MNAHQRKWCVFTSAGDNNNVRGWLRGQTSNNWDLVTAYYGNNDQEYLDLANLSSHCFRSKGGKFQILKRFAAQNPRYFDQYSYVWVLDDDTQIVVGKIEDAFAIAESFEFWIAQPAFLPQGKISHPITAYAGPHCDYRLVNFVELGAPIFRSDKLCEFLNVFDGSLTGYGVDYWYMNHFEARELSSFGSLIGDKRSIRFAIIDKVQAINPNDGKKGGREIDRLKPTEDRLAEWNEARKKYNLFEYHHKVFASCKIGGGRKVGPPCTRWDIARQILTDFAHRAHTIRRAGPRSSFWRTAFDFRVLARQLLLRGREFRSSRPALVRARLPTLVEQMGYQPYSRLLIVHADDLGVAQSVNTAFITGVGTGLINSGSVIVPARFFPEIIAFGSAYPDVDLGIHLTLTCEWAQYGWGPVAAHSKVSSLIDDHGQFNPTWTKQMQIDLRQVELELGAQIEKTYQAGLRPTHLDSHQFRLQQYGRRLFEIYLRLGRKYDLPVLVTRDWFAKFPYMQRSLTPGDMVIDHVITIGTEISSQQWPAYYRTAIQNLEPGITQCIIHPGLDNEELQAATGDRLAWGAKWRQRDFDFFSSDEFRHVLDENNVKLITWREIQKAVHSTN